MNAHDTIVALSSAPGPAARGILRLSGPDALPIATPLTHNLPPHPSVGLHQIHLRDPHLPATLLYFKSPHSFTGEDTIEFHLPGSSALLKMLQDQCHTAGARSADPGEFSARAFFNGKIDLTQAEGIAATIAAQSQDQLRAAATLRDGFLHEWTNTATQTLAGILALVEAEIDFSDEPGVTFASAGETRKSIQHLWKQMLQLKTRSIRWERIGHRPQVVLTGLPNVGKSSLINALSGTQRAIVSPIAGTTRDALAVAMAAPFDDILLIDVAGAEHAPDALQTDMNAARDRAIQDADLVLLLYEGSETTSHEWALDEMIRLRQDHPDVPLSLLQTKIDLQADYEPHAQPGHVEFVSAKTGEGIADLRRHLADQVRAKPSAGAALSTLNRRHFAILAEAIQYLVHCEFLTARHSDDFTSLPHPELLAADLRSALDALGQITGTISPDDILGRIFSTFCIGK